MIILGAVFGFIGWCAFMVLAYFWVEHVFEVIKKELNTKDGE